jgi:hypothetical protein
MDVRKRRLDMIKKSQDIAKVEILKAGYFLCVECIELTLERNMDIFNVEKRGKRECPAHGSFQSNGFLKIECIKCAIARGRCQRCNKKLGKTTFIMEKNEKN